MNNQLKQYTGTKTVKARPMTMGEAYERKLLKEGRRPSECETDKAGYLVEYEGGYQSWSPAEPFEKTYKVAETPLDRMYIEYNEESERYQKGNKFINSMNFDKLNDLAKTFLSSQNESQREYCYLLANRIDQMSNKQLFPTYYDFGTAIKLLKAGGAVCRAGWNDNGLFVIKQVPAHIKADIIPNMQSLPQSAKKILMSRDNPHIDYTNQMLIINPDVRADSWVPSSSDIFANECEEVVE